MVCCIALSYDARCAILYCCDIFSMYCISLTKRTWLGIREGNLTLKSVGIGIPFAGNFAKNATESLTFFSLCPFSTIFYSRWHNSFISKNDFQAFCKVTVCTFSIPQSKRGFLTYFSRQKGLDSNSFKFQTSQKGKKIKFLMSITRRKFCFNFPAKEKLSNTWNMSHFSLKTEREEC